MFGGVFSVAVVFLLVINDGCGCSSLQEALPLDSLLVDGCFVEWVSAWEFVVSGWVVEPLDEAL